ncbi:MAG: lamin tail domain-containing protein [Methanothrix sp.]|jgi:hypothetical protein|nr:lamin tail domain-containing protein [Methanothrix sp.]OPX81777.1 MAG: Intermediate filament tail domain protein [Methanosaeta sp. PtaB.Bin087]NLX39652.1 lamin tail domain-containing protein [Methanothrix sp.]HNR57715.1 lamin tail domain-containing protein [Methanothrix sp.]HNT72223.1 lamin tail domain-containing protein [Methanothrix sp.]
MNSISMVLKLILISALAISAVGISWAEGEDVGIDAEEDGVYGVGIENVSWVDEWVEISNLGESAQDLTGWTLKDEQNHTYSFPEGFVLAAGGRVLVHTGVGDDSATDLYMNLGTPIWNNGGDLATLMDADGNVVSAFTKPEGEEGEE